MFAALSIANPRENDGNQWHEKYHTFENQRRSGLASQARHELVAH